MTKKLFLSVSIAATFLFFGCGSSNEKTNEVTPAADTSHGESVMAHDSLSGATAYICPCGGCPEIRESGPGKCSKCEMDLVAEKK